MCVCLIFLFSVDDRRDVSRYGEDNRGYGGSQGGGRGRGGYDKDGRGPMTGSGKFLGTDAYISFFFFFSWFDSII